MAGSTAVTFTDADLPNSLIRVFSTNANIYPSQISLSGTTLTVRYEEQTSSIGVAVEMIKSGLTVYDDLDSSSSEYALSAAQGKALNDEIGSLAGSTSEAFSDVYDYIGSMEITDLSDVDFSSPSQGQVLGFDSDLGITNLPAPSALDNYLTTEHVVGTWIDGRTIYEITYYIASLPSSAGVTIYSVGTTGVDSCWLKDCIIGVGNGFIIRNDQSDYAAFKTASITFRPSVTDGDIKLNCYNGQNRSSTSAYVTIRYFKTT